MSAPALVDVEIRSDAEGIHVSPIWQGVDRPNTGGWLLSTKHQALAQRLRQAILAGVVFRSPEIVRDKAGKTYVSQVARVGGRTLNADLRRLGF